MSQLLRSVSWSYFDLLISSCGHVCVYRCLLVDVVSGDHQNSMFSWRDEQILGRRTAFGCRLRCLPQEGPLCATARIWWSSREFSIHLYLISILLKPSMSFYNLPYSLNLLYSHTFRFTIWTCFIEIFTPFYSFSSFLHVTSSSFPWLHVMS